MLVLLSQLFCGVGIFLFAMHLLSDGFSNRFILPSRAQRFLNKPLNAFSYGLIATLLCQSSSAINGVTINLSNASKLEKKCSYLAVMGANIGTTATAYFVVLSRVNAADVLKVLILFASVILMTAKNKRLKDIAFLTAVFSLIFAGISVTAKSVPIFSTYFNTANLLPKNLILLLLFSIGITAVFQSSSLVSVFAVSFAALNIIDKSGAVFLMIGANVGTCSTSLFVALGKNAAAKSVAYFNLLFNCIGMVFFVFCYYVGFLNPLINADISADVFTALFHTVFNAVTAILFLPFILERKKRASYVCHT